MQANTTYDMPQNYYFGGGGGTFAPPLAMAALFIACGLVLFLRRKHALIPFLTGGITLLPYGVNLTILGLNFPALRILVTAAWIRMLIKRDMKPPRLNAIDKAFLTWATLNAIAFCVLWGTITAVVNRFGFLWTTLGSYFIARAMIRNKDELVMATKTIAVIFAILAPAMIIEHITGRNPFSPFGAPQLSEVRDGVVRAMGPFGHPIIAGTIAAVFVPLFAGMWWTRKDNRGLHMTGILACGAMAIVSASSTPLMALVSGALALSAWPVRRHLRAVRWIALSLIVALQLVMKAPVWFLLNHVGGAIGGSGYHRTMLIDNFVRHFGDWWLTGTRDNANWGYDMWDVDNAYVAAGFGGGLLTFIAFLVILVLIYQQLGKSLKAVRRSRENERIVWALGASVFAGTIGFLGIVYFDQSILLWYSVLAMASITPSLATQTAAATMPAKKQPIAACLVN